MSQKEEKRPTGCYHQSLGKIATASLASFFLLFLLSACSNHSERSTSSESKHHSKNLRSNNHDRAGFNSNSKNKRKEKLCRLLKSDRLVKEVIQSDVKLALLTPESFGIHLGVTKVKEIAKKFKLIAVKPSCLGKNYCELIFLTKNLGRNVPLMNVLCDTKRGVIRSVLLVYPREKDTFDELKLSLSKQFQLQLGSFKNQKASQGPKISKDLDFAFSFGSSTNPDTSLFLNKSAKSVALCYLSRSLLLDKAMINGIPATKSR